MINGPKLFCGQTKKSNVFKLQDMPFFVQVLSVTVQIYQRAPSNVLLLPSWWEDGAVFVAGYYIEIRCGIFQVICDEMTQRVASYALCDPPSKEISNFRNDVCIVKND